MENNISCIGFDQLGIFGSIVFDEQVLTNIATMEEYFFQHMVIRELHSPVNIDPAEICVAQLKALRTIQLGEITIGDTEQLPYIVAKIHVGCLQVVEVVLIHNNISVDVNIIQLAVIKLQVIDNFIIVDPEIF